MKFLLNQKLLLISKYIQNEKLFPRIISEIVFVDINSRLRELSPWYRGIISLKGELFPWNRGIIFLWNQVNLRNQNTPLSVTKYYQFPYPELTCELIWEMYFYFMWSNYVQTSWRKRKLFSSSRKKKVIFFLKKKKVIFFLKEKKVIFFLKEKKVIFSWTKKKLFSSWRKKSYFQTFWSK